MMGLRAYLDTTRFLRRTLGLSDYPRVTQILSEQQIQAVRPGQGSRYLHSSVCSRKMYLQVRPADSSQSCETAPCRLVR